MFPLVPQANHALRQILQDAEGKSYGFTFTDGTALSAVIVSTSHIDQDDSLILLRTTATPSEPALNVSLDEISSLATTEGKLLFERK